MVETKGGPAISASTCFVRALPVDFFRRRLFRKSCRLSFATMRPPHLGAGTPPPGFYRGSPSPRSHPPATPPSPPPAARVAAGAGAGGPEAAVTRARLALPATVFRDAVRRGDA